MLVPIALRKFILDQLVCGRCIGDAQQGFGHAHQQHAFLGGKVILGEKGLHADTDAAALPPTATDSLHQRTRGGGDGRIVGKVKAGSVEEQCQRLGLVRQKSTA